MRCRRKGKDNKALENRQTILKSKENQLVLKINQHVSSSKRKSHRLFFSQSPCPPPEEYPGQVLTPQPINIIP